MVSLKKVKQYLVSSDKIVILLERLGLKNIKREQDGTLITCGLPESDNNRSVQIRIDNNLTINIRNKNVHGDIIDLISYMTYNGFGDIDDEVMDFIRDDSIRWLIGNLEKDFEGFEYDEASYQANQTTSKDFLKENDIYNKNVLDEFIPIPHASWVRDGISPYTQDEFDIMYDLHGDRIVIPCRSPNGDIVSIKVRNISLTGNYVKYFSIVMPSVGTDLYGLWKTKEYIKKEKSVILFESEKSVMKAWQYGYKNSVALGTSSLSNRHKNQLLKVLEDDYEVIIALDNDMEMVDIKRVSKRLRKSGFKITYIKQGMESENLLEGKDSPTDKGPVIFKEMFENRKSLI